VKHLWFFLLIISLTACQTNSSWLAKDDRNLPWMGKIFAPVKGNWVSEQSMLEDIQTADIILLGERHDHPDHWRLQLQLSKGLAKRARPVFVFEHFNRNQQDDLDRLVKEEVPAAAWGEELAWEKSGWPEWARFQPLIAFALSHDIPLIAANLERAAVKSLYQSDYTGVFEDDVVERFRLSKEPLAKHVAIDLAKQLEKSHCHPMSEAMLESMLRVQRGRDLAMAEAIAQQVAQGRAVILYAGHGHVRADWGVPEILARLAESSSWKIRSLAMIQAPSDWEEYREQGLPYDYVWLTPAIDLRDPCEVYREQLQKFQKQD